MNEIDTRQVLWNSVAALMQHHWKGENLTRLAREADIGPGSASRLKKQSTSVGLELLDKIARVFGIAPWQLLVPGFDPKNPPTLLPMSEASALSTSACSRPPRPSKAQTPDPFNGTFGCAALNCNGPTEFG